MMDDAALNAETRVRLQDAETNAACNAVASPRAGVRLLRSLLPPEREPDVQPRRKRMLPAARVRRAQDDNAPLCRRQCMPRQRSGKMGLAV